MGQKRQVAPSRRKRNKTGQSPMSLIEKLTIENQALNKILKSVNTNGPKTN